MSKNETFATLPHQSRLTIQAFAKLDARGREVLHTMLETNTKFLAMASNNSVLFVPADSKFRPKDSKKDDDALRGVDFRVLLAIMRAGFAEMPKEATKADTKERYRRFWVPGEVWATLVEVQEHLRPVA